MGEHRKLKRRHLIYYLKVMDRDTGEILGFLVDITTQGIMIMSEQPIKTGRTFHLQLLIPSDEDAAEKKYLRFDARSRWSERSINTDFYDTGLELININIEEFETIEKIIHELGFDD